MFSKEILKMHKNDIDLLFDHISAIYDYLDLDVSVGAKYTSRNIILTPKKKGKKKNNG